MLLLLLFVFVWLPVMAVCIAQIAASSSNLRAKKHPDRPRPRHWWQRWEVWCRLERGGEILSEKEYGWFPFRWMARQTASHLQGDPNLLLATMATMDSLHEGLMIFPEFEVRRLK